MSCLSWQNVILFGLNILYWLQNGIIYCNYACGTKIEIGKLADLVAEHFPNIEIVRPVEDNSLDDYFPRDSDFEILAARMGVMLSDLQIQVSRTVKGHIDAFRG